MRFILCVGILLGAFDKSFAGNKESKRIRMEFVQALIMQESSGNDKAVGDKGKAKGCLQIWQVVVDDVNRVYKTKYTHDDMFDRTKAIDVCNKYLSYWGRNYEKKTGKKPTEEVLARIWNSGPNGWNKSCSIVYWYGVKKILAS